MQAMAKKHLTKGEAARFITENYFRVGPRSLDNWPLTRFRPGKSVLFNVDELVEVARAKLAESAHRAA